MKLDRKNKNLSKINVKSNWWFGIWQQCRTFDNISISRSLHKNWRHSNWAIRGEYVSWLPFFRMGVSCPVEKTSGTKSTTNRIWYNSVNNSYTIHKVTCKQIVNSARFFLFQPKGICSYIQNRYGTVRNS